LGTDVVARVKLERRGANRADLGRDAVGCVPTSRAWHPSELNALAECPFTYLAKYRLKLRTTEPPDFEIPPTEIGKLAHDILREFYLTPVPLDERQALQRMDTIIRRRLADADVSGQGPFSVFDPALWRIRRTQLVAALHQYVGFAVRDAFAGYETLAGYLDNPLPPAQLGSINLAGRPDHIAVRRIGERIEAIRVDDFKYSAASSATSKLLRDSFQVPVYAYLAARAVNAELTTQIDGRYLLLRSPSTPVVSHAIDVKVFEELEGRIETLVAKARSGQLHPEPADRQECSGCDYRRLCRLYGG
jgi:CRISPR/Cas system-associated exonuclease Cas4 (RecB family)